MKIAMVIEHLDPTRGSSETLALWSAQELARRGHEIHVICHDSRKRVNRYRAATNGASHDAHISASTFYLPETQTYAGLLLHRLKGMSVSSGFGYRRFGARARQLARKLRPDIVYSFSVAFPGDIYNPQPGIYACMHAQAVASRSGVNSQWKQLMLALSPKQQSLLMLEERAMRPVDRGGVPKIIGISDMIIRELTMMYNVAPERIFSLSNPRLIPDPDFSQKDTLRHWLRAHLGVDPDARMAIFVGHDFRRKGLRYAIDAIAQTRHKWHLLVMGLGKAQPYLEQIAAAGLQNRVHLLGPTQELSAAYMASDALLLPTFYDSFGQCAIQALAHGLPVISTEFLGACDIIRRYRVGEIVSSPRETQQMALALDSLPQPGAKLNTLMARAHKASSQMTGPLYMDHLCNLMTDVLKERHMS